MQIFVVLEEQEEGSWGFCDFTSEAYYSEKEAEVRAEILNKKRPVYCGYHFSVRPAELKGNSIDKRVN